MNTLKETVNIDLDTIDADKLWDIYKKWIDNQIDIDPNIWRDQRFTHILLSAPQVTYSEVVNGLLVEKSDCFRTQLIRVPSLSMQWRVCMKVNVYNAEMSWNPDYVELMDTEDYLISLSTHQVFKLVKS